MNRKTSQPFYICRSCGKPIYLVFEQVAAIGRFGGATRRKAHSVIAAAHEHEVNGRTLTKRQHRQGDVVRVKLEERCRNESASTL